MESLIREPDTHTMAETMFEFCINIYFPWFNANIVRPSYILRTPENIQLMDISTLNHGFVVDTFLNRCISSQYTYYILMVWRLKKNIHPVGSIITHNISWYNHSINECQRNIPNWWGPCLNNRAWLNLIVFIRRVHICTCFPYMVSSACIST